MTKYTEMKIEKKRLRIIEEIKIIATDLSRLVRDPAIYAPKIVSKNEEIIGKIRILEGLHQKTREDQMVISEKLNQTRNELKELADEARISISDYCINDCKAFCCRKGYLMLSLEELKLVVGKERRSLEDAGFLTEIENKEFVLNLGNPGSCPSLKDNKCLIHKNSKRNSACKEFPIFITGNKVRFSDRCLAVKANQFYSYVHKFKKIGFTIE